MLRWETMHISPINSMQLDLIAYMFHWYLLINELYDLLLLISRSEYSFKCAQTWWIVYSHCFTISLKNLITLCGN